MKISAINYEQKNINFASTKRIVNDENGHCENFTTFFRDDINWNTFAETLNEKYKNEDKVNVYCYACSDGSEPYTLAMLLISKLGEEAKKFFPIIAKDKDDFFLEKAKKGEVEIDLTDIKAIEKYTKKKASDFFDIEADLSDKKNAKFVTKFKNNIKNKIIFEQGNILDDIDALEKENSIILFRNAWLYLSDGEQHRLARKLKENLGKNSINIIGDYDFKNSDVLEKMQKNELKLKMNGNFFYYDNPSFTGRTTLNDPRYLLNIFANTSK